MDETKRRQRNADRLKELFPTFRARIAAVIADLEGQGVRPRIQDAWRSPADQLKAFESGHSKLKFGFHNVVAADGSPEGLAVDMLDDDSPLAPSSRYLLLLARAARRQGLQTGILWGLPKALQAAVETALAEEDFDAPVKVGWDPTHIEPLGLTPAEAKAGKRPS